jgi:hypothetical protein
MMQIFLSRGTGLISGCRVFHHFVLDNADFSSLGTGLISGRNEWREFLNE